FGTLVRAFGGGILWVFSTQLLLQLVPDRVRGRVFSTEFALFTLANAIGAASGGWLMDNTSLSVAGMMEWMAAAAVIPAVLWLLWTMFGEKAQPLPEEEEPPAALAGPAEPEPAALSD
ncbi:MAG TPA: hypothetical protein VE136_12580, partial [Anaerolineales bacterium]|nr:hypothetical protein [Anaerolineales bacterium]